jgi:hypothetical protein
MHLLPFIIIPSPLIHASMFPCFPLPFVWGAYWHGFKLTFPLFVLAYQSPKPFFISATEFLFSGIFFHSFLRVSTSAHPHLFMLVSTCTLSLFQILGLEIPASPSGLCLALELSLCNFVLNLGALGIQTWG